MARLKLKVVVFIAVIFAAHAAVTVNYYEDDVEPVKEKEVHKVEDCDPANCNRVCQMLGFKFGVCRGDNCQCSSFAKDDDVEPVKEKEVHKVEDCDPANCNRVCQMLGFKFGVCRGDNCQCSSFAKDDDIETNDIFSMHEDATGTTLSDCNSDACAQLCSRLQFPEGACVSGRCKCDDFRQESDQLETNDIPSLDEDTPGKGLSNCDPSACNQLCRRLQFPGGICVNGRCKCDNFRQASGLNQIAAVDACNAYVCSQTCHRLGFRYGVCIGGICRCSNMRNDVLDLDEDINEENDNSLEDNVETVPTIAALDCNVACTMGCTELGFPGGSCFLGNCRCNRRDNEEKRSRSFQDCTNVNCYFMCVRWGYLSGRCLGGICLCA